MLKTILRLPSVKSYSGLSRSTLYLRIRQGLWTKPISLGGRSVGWPANELIALNAARIAERTDEDIRSLVKSLEADRKRIPLKLLSNMGFSQSKCETDRGDGT